MSIYKFYTESCILCRRVDTFLKSCNVEYTNINIELNKDMQDRYKIYTVPTIVKLDSNGNEVSRVEGLDVTKLKELVREELKND